MWIYGCKMIDTKIFLHPATKKKTIEKKKERIKRTKKKKEEHKKYCEAEVLRIEYFILSRQISLGTPSAFFFEVYISFFFFCN